MPPTIAQASQLALLGGTRVGEVVYSPFPTFTERAIERAAEMLRTGKLFGLGRKHAPEIAEAEEVISRYHGNRHVLATASGHGALQSALAGLEICGGDETRSPSRSSTTSMAAASRWSMPSNAPPT
jgi:dTDP-4-amino-4,6-dideoxygalactose transaminase